MSAADTTYPIFLVDDEPHARLSMELALRSVGLSHTIQVDDPSKLVPLLEKASGRALVMLDLVMPGRSGGEILVEVVREFPEVPVVVVTGVNDVGTAVDCMRKGAADYILKPIEQTRLISCVKRLLEILELRDVNTILKEGLAGGGLRRPEAFAKILTANSPMHALFHYVEAVAGSAEPVLIMGETGVGKELFARALHETSGRTGAFVAVDMGGLDANLLADTLFGHVKGSYTGADADRAGLVEKAAKGTLFLDEIGGMGLDTQAKLLRLIQEREYKPLGSDADKLSSARIVAATNTDLQNAVKDGTFRKDLYFRLHQHYVHIPPLRERKEDLVLLLESFITEAAHTLGKTPPTHPKELATHLQCHHFPGNVRELKAMTLDAVAKCRSGQLSITDFLGKKPHPPQAGEPEDVPRGGDIAGVLETLEQLPTFKQAQDALLGEALRRTGGNQHAASRLLGVTRQAISHRLAKHGA